MPDSELPAPNLFRFNQRMLAQLADPLAEKRSRAARYFRFRASHEALGPLRTALRDEDEDVRYWAARGLGELRESSCIPDLGRALLEDADEFVRTESAWALAKLGIASAAVPLVQAVVRGIEREVAGLALGSLGGPALEAMLAALARRHGMESDAAIALIHALAEIKDPRACEVLLAILEDDNEHPDVRVEAGDALSAIDDPNYSWEVDHSLECLSYWQDDNPFKGSPPEPPVELEEERARRARGREGGSG